MSESLGRPSGRDGIVWLALIGFVGAGIWLASGTDPASGLAKGGECQPVCHRCADVAGKHTGPGLAPLARHCVPGCAVCVATRAANRRLERTLIALGAIEPN